GKAVCIGRNYADHALELQNPIPQQPILFMKPSTALVPMTPDFSVPYGQGSCHHEAEIALLINRPVDRDVTPETALSYIGGIGLALDLTLRDLQDELRKKGHPWERAKAFDGACPVSPFIEINKITNVGQLGLELLVNGRLRQQGLATNMLFPLTSLLIQIAEIFTLLPGDLILTGTPSGVGQLMSGDQLQMRLLSGEQILMRMDTKVK